MIRVRDLRDTIARFTEHPVVRTALPFAVLGAVVVVLVDALGHHFLPSPSASAAHLSVSIGYVAGVLFLITRAALRVADSQRRGLRASEARFRNLTRLSADWFWETDAEARLSWISGGAQVFALLGERSVYGLRFWELPGVTIDPVALAACRDCIAEARPFSHVELESINAQGVRVIHAISAEPRFDADGDIAGYRGVARDVTRQRSAEQALAKAKERLDLAVAGGGMVVGDIDLRSGVVYLGDGWASLLGQDEHGGRTLHLTELAALIRRGDVPAVRDAYVDALKGRVAGFSVEYRVRQKDGRWRWVMSVGRVSERDGSGRAVRVTGMAMDIDARKLAERALRETEQRYRSLAEVSPDGIIVDADGVIEYANPAAARIFRARQPRAMIGLRTERVFPDPTDPVLLERWRYLNSGPGYVPFQEHVLKALDGGQVMLEAAAVSYLEGGRLLVQVVLRDAGELRRARAELAEREQRFRDVVEASGEYVWETNAALQLSFLSSRVETVLGYAPGELLGRTLSELAPLGEARTATEFLRGEAARTSAFRNFQLRTMTKAGRVIWQSLSGLPVRDASGVLIGYRGTGADITARKHAEERIQHLATRDALTGLPNRALFVDRIGQAVLAAGRRRSRFAVLVLDIDRFKLVNDALGHATGDSLLRAVAERLARTLGRPDALARLAGNEFAVLWEGIRAAEDADALASRLTAVFAQPFRVGEHALSATMSVGISLYPMHGTDAQTVLRCAEVAMHRAKDLGRGRHVHFSADLSERAGDRLTMESDLQRAIQSGELSLFWQPVLRSRAAGGDPVLMGAEALLRWTHPVRGAVPPDIFIPVAEESGLIRELGEWTLDRALSRIGAWARARPGRTYSVNVSAIELALGDAYVERIREGMSAHDVPAGALELEVTERVLLAQLPANMETLQRIGALGVRIAIDDFGTGYSSLAYLRRLPVQKLKIDRSFVHELDRNPADSRIVRGIVALAESLGLEVAAEGVENRDQLARLLALGCRDWQGHHYSEALEAERFERLGGATVRAAS